MDKRLDAEIKRIDALRAEDCDHVKIANESAFKQAVLLQQEVSRSAEVLREAVAKTADTIARQFSQVTEEMYKRISMLEKIQYEFQGKSLSTPDLLGPLNELRRKGDYSEGRHSLTTPMLATIFALAGGLIVGLMEAFFRKAWGG